MIKLIIVIDLVLLATSALGDELDTESSEPGGLLGPMGALGPLGPFESLLDRPLFGPNGLAKLLDEMMSNDTNEARVVFSYQEVKSVMVNVSEAEGRPPGGAIDRSDFLQPARERFNFLLTLFNHMINDDGPLGHVVDHSGLPGLMDTLRSQLLGIQDAMNATATLEGALGSSNLKLNESVKKEFVKEFESLKERLDFLNSTVAAKVEKLAKLHAALAVESLRQTKNNSEAVAALSKTLSHEIDGLQDRLADLNASIAEVLLVTEIFQELFEHRMMSRFEEVRESLEGVLANHSARLDQTLKKSDLFGFFSATVNATYFEKRLEELREGLVTNAICLWQGVIATAKKASKDTDKLGTKLIALIAVLAIVFVVIIWCLHARNRRKIRRLRKELGGKSMAKVVLTPKSETILPA